MFATLPALFRDLFEGCLMKPWTVRDGLEFLALQVKNKTFKFGAVVERRPRQGIRVVMHV
jgi:hypothetical protein